MKKDIRTDLKEIGIWTGLLWINIWSIGWFLYDYEP